MSERGWVVETTDVGDPYRTWATAALVTGALHGDEAAWNEIVRRHVPAVLAQIRQFRLGPEHAEDVAQTVWLNLLENLERLRDPAALPGWISTTARHECIRITNRNRRSVPVDPQTGSLDIGVDQDLDAGMEQVERYRALREGLAQLPEHQRELLLLLSTDPPLSYQEISARLGIPVGSIGPTRGRGLARLRQTPAIKNYLATSAGTAFGEGGDSVLALD